MEVPPWANILFIPPLEKNPPAVASPNQIFSPSSKVHSPPSSPLDNNFHIRTPINTSFLVVAVAPVPFLF